MAETAADLLADAAESSRDKARQATARVAEQMSQALLNLLSNACQAVSAAVAEPQVLLTIARDGERCLIMVEDNGPGVPDDLRETVFMPFFTTKEHGSGIGLPLSRQIAAGHGVELKLDRSPTMGGARFVMRV